MDRGEAGRLVMGGWKALYSPPAAGGRFKSRENGMEKERVRNEVKNREP